MTTYDSEPMSEEELAISYFESFRGKPGEFACIVNLLLAAEDGLWCRGGENEMHFHRIREAALRLPLPISPIAKRGSA
ncbi:MAG: hypothetical protein AB7O24_28585 [Kofleriaceae bacterium]